MHPPEERAAFLDAACADDPDLRAEIDSLLAADADADSDAFLAEPPTEWDEAIQAAEAAHTDHMLEGRQIGPYRVLRALGQGGMGDVYLGVREEPFRRYVALKVIRRGTDSREVLTRFAIERQILASLDHPGIARLIDGGMTDEGLPYFAMEYVEGQSITAYCDERRLTIPERLRLFVSVCEAVHVAHQNLVLHRDLKPSNILVTAKDEVKLLDFGIAKLLNPQMSHLTVPVTRAETRMLTPEYASPEQIRGEPLTTTSDVYSLGVLLYELLAGRRPHRLAGRSTQEMIRIVSDEAPITPSTAVTRTPTAVPDVEHAAPSDVAVARNLTPDRLQRRLRGDLDAICLKALRKEPNHRYGSAELLAQDIERHLAQEPVSARRGNRRYRLSSFLRRYRVETTAAALVLVALVGGLGTALWQAGEARRERDRSQIEATKAEEVSAFLVSLLQQADPTETVGDTLTVRQVLDEGAARVETELSGQPEVQASLFVVIADAYQHLGRLGDAKPLVEQAYTLRRETLGDDHSDTLESLLDFASTHVQLGDFEPAEGLFRTYIEQARLTYGPNDPRILPALNELVSVLHVQQRRAEADSIRTVWRTLVDAMPDEDHPALASSLSSLANLLFIRREYDESEAYIRRALAMSRRLEGDSSRAVGVDLNRLAHTLNRLGRYAEGETTARDALALNTMLYPDGHYQVGNSLSALGESLQYRGRFDEAEEYLRENMVVRERLHPDGHYTVARAYSLLASLEHERGRYDEAEQWYRRSIDLFEQFYGPTFLTTIEHRLMLTDVLRDQGRYDEAEVMLLSAYENLDGRRGHGGSGEARALRRLVTLYEAWGKPDEAQRYQALLEATDT